MLAKGLPPAHAACAGRLRARARGPDRRGAARRRRRDRLRRDPRAPGRAVGVAGWRLPPAGSRAAGRELSVEFVSLSLTNSTLSTRDGRSCRVEGRYRPLKSTSSPRRPALPQPHPAAVAVRTGQRPLAGGRSAALELRICSSDTARASAPSNTAPVPGRRRRDPALERPALLPAEPLRASVGSRPSRAASCGPAEAVAGTAGARPPSQRRGEALDDPADRTLRGVERRREVERASRSSAEPASRSASVR